MVAVVLCAVALRHHGPARVLLCPLAVGYLSHLAADLLTPRGLRLAWPLPQGFAVPLCRTGSPTVAPDASPSRMKPTCEIVE